MTHFLVSLIVSRNRIINIYSGYYSHGFFWAQLDACVIIFIFFKLNCPTVGTHLFPVDCSSFGMQCHKHNVKFHSEINGIYQNMFSGHVSSRWKNGCMLHHPLSRWWQLTWYHFLGGSFQCCTWWVDPSKTHPSAPWVAYTQCLPHKTTGSRGRECAEPSRTSFKWRLLVNHVTNTAPSRGTLVKWMKLKVTERLSLHEQRSLRCSVNRIHNINPKP